MSVVVVQYGQDVLEQLVRRERQRVAAGVVSVECEDECVRLWCERVCEMDESAVVGRCECRRVSLQYGVYEVAGGGGRDTVELAEYGGCESASGRGRVSGR